MRKLLSKHPALFALTVIWTCFWIANFMFDRSHIPSFLRVTGVDFDQYYAASVAVEHGWWEDLYPENLSNHRRPMDAPLSERLQKELNLRQAPSRTKWIFPPPLAVLFLPLAWFDYGTSLAVFSAVSILVLLFLLAQTESLFLSSKTEFLHSQVLVFLLGVSHGTRNGLMACNISQLVGVGVALSFVGIVSNNTAKTICGFLIAGITKGCSVVWIPFLLLKKQWPTIVRGAVVGVCLFAATIAIGASFETFETFLGTVIPAGRGVLYSVKPPNLCVGSAAVFFLGNVSLTPIVLQCCSVALPTLLCLMYLLVWTRAKTTEFENTTTLVLFASLSLYNLFSNICWWHYTPQFFPLIPGLLAIARIHSKTVFITFLACFSVTFLDPGITMLASRHFNQPAFEYLFTAGLSGCSALSLFWLYSSVGKRL